jgi:peptidoglycan-associated lipoprotein
MLRTHPGHGGWGNNRTGAQPVQGVREALRDVASAQIVIVCGAVLRTVSMAAIICAIAMAGCSSKKSAGQGAGGTGANGSQLGQEGVGGAGGSSLSKYQQGTLGNGEQGPLSDIHFDYNDFTVRPQDSEILHGNADWLQKHPNRRVQIEGHCDDRGSEEYNIALGAKRAQAAKDYLQTLGVAGDRLSTISYGKELPLCTDHTEECWQQNRRAHFALTE